MNTLINVVPDIGESYPQSEINSSRLFAIKTKGKAHKFMLIKTAKYPQNKFVLSHFEKPVSRAILNRYITANL